MRRVLIRHEPKPFLHTCFQFQNILPNRPSVNLRRLGEARVASLTHPLFVYSTIPNQRARRKRSYFLRPGIVLRISFSLEIIT